MCTTATPVWLLLGGGALVISLIVNVVFIVNSLAKQQDATE